jgi:hypothetical protein
MIKVKTFTQSLEIFKTHKELESLDSIVNEYIKKNNVKSVVSVSDTTTSDDSGATIGLIRILTYEI